MQRIGRLHGMKMLLAIAAIASTLSVSGQSVTSIDREQLLDLLKQKNDSVYVVNFWATWCSPCVKEIGYFEELSEAYSDNAVEVLLVNLDFPNQVDRRVIPFLQEKGISSRVLNMTDLDYNSWISKVDASWSGAIPATLIYSGNKRTFIGGEVTREELFAVLRDILEDGITE